MMVLSGRGAGKSIWIFLLIFNYNLELASHIYHENKYLNFYISF
jgi:hypothetical protein